MFSMTRWGRHLGLIAATLTLLFVLPLGLYATHIVGGEITYRSLGNNRYEITLRVYRDCINGAIGFDDPASIGIFDRDGTLIDDLRLAFVSSQPVTNPLNACFTSSSPVCVETTTYTTIVTLKPKLGGYRFVYQRCCRNKTINNIIDPVNTGATYDILLSETAMARNNNSPRFSEEWPPIYICSTLPFRFNHSATDVDGDSLVYSLCAPFQGGTFAQPLPQPPMSPPYDEVIFKTAGGFSVTNLLGGTTEPLRINSSSGLMTATPDYEGQYVVGVCIQEYDRKTKQLLSVTRRDFQYNVLRCDRTTAAFVSPNAQCDTLQVKFQNNSTKASNFKWFFDSPKNTLSSILRDPVFTFPDTGHYKIKLIAEPGTQCVDSATTDIFLQKNSIQANVKADAFRCSTESILQVEDLSTDKVSGIASRLWEVTLSTGQKFTDTGIKPTFRLPLGANGTVKLTVRTKNGCTQILERVFNTQTATDPTTVIADTIKACIGSTVELNPNTPANSPWTFRWSPAGGLDNSNAINPKLLVSGNAAYSVTLTSSTNACQFTKLVTILASPKVKAAFTASLACDGFTVNTTNTSTSSSKYQWTVGNANQPLFQSTLTTPSFTFRDTGTFAIQLVATGFCSDTAKQTVRVTGKRFHTDFTTNYVSCVLGGSTIRFIDKSVDLDTIGAKWLWLLGDGRTSTAHNPIFSFSQGSTTNVTLIVTTANGCKDTMSRSVLVAPIANINYPDTVSICAGGSVTLNTSNSPAYVYQWSPTQGINNPQAVNPTFTPTQTTTYTVSISISGQPTCQITDKVVALVQPAIGLKVTGDGTTCAAQTTLTASSTNPANYRWLDANGGLLGTGPQLTVNVSGEQKIQLSALDARGCVENRTVTVAGGPVNVDIASTVAGCSNETIRIQATNKDANDVLTYSWSPLNAFASGTDTASPVLASNPGERTVFVDIKNQFGCTLRDTVKIAIVDQNIQLGFTAAPQCDGRTVKLTNTSTNAFGYLWTFGDPKNPTATSSETNPSYVYSEPGQYTITLTTKYNVSCKSTVQQVVNLATTKLTANFSAQYQNCGADGAVIAFKDLTVNTFNNALSWQWKFSNGATSTLQNPSVSVTQAGTLIATLTATNATGCTSTFVDTLNVIFAKINLPDTIKVCSGKSVALNPGGDPKLTYRWSPATDLSSTTIANPIAQPKTTTTYRVTVTAFGFDTCTTTDQVTVVVAPPISVKAPDDRSTCGEDARLTATITGTGSVSWINKGQVIGTGSSIVVNPFKAEKYFVQVTDASGCSATDSVTVTDNGVDVKLTNPANGEIKLCDVQDVKIEVTNLDAEDQLIYSWRPTANIVSGGNTATPTIRVASGTVTILGFVTNQFNCRDTVSVKVSVGAIDPKLPAQVAVCPKVATPLAPGAVKTYTYQWAPSTGLSATNISNPIFTGTQSVTYQVTVSDNSTGILCQVVKEVKVVVSPVSLKASPLDTTVCEGVTVNLKASGADNYAWFLGDGFNKPFGTGATLAVNQTPGRNLFSVIGKNAAGCADTIRNIVVTVKPFKPGTLTSPQTICQNTPTQINFNGTPGYQYTWSPTAGLNLSTPSAPIATLANSTTYKVTVVDPIGGCSVQKELVINVRKIAGFAASADTVVCSPAPITVRATAANGTSVSWVDAAGNPLGNGNRITVTPKPGVNQYIAIGNDGICSIRDTVNVKLENFKPGDLASPQEVCIDSPTALNPNGNPAYRYTWSQTAGLNLANPYNPIVQVSVNTTYKVTVTDPATGCTVSKDILVTVRKPTTVVASPDTTLCAPGQINLRATSSRPGIITWYSDRSLTQVIGTGNRIIVPGVAGKNVFYAAIRDTSDVCYKAGKGGIGNPGGGTGGNGGASLNGVPGDSAVVNIIDINKVGPPTDLTVCRNTPTPLNPNASTNFTYSWAPPTGLSSTIVGNPSVTTSTETSYSVTITSNNNLCTTVRTVNVKIAAQILPDAGRDTLLCSLSPYSLTGKGTGATRFEWSLNRNFNPTLGQGSPFTITPTPGSRYYYLRVTNSNGCTEIDSVKINAVPVQATLPATLSACVPGEEIPVDVVNNDPTQTLRYAWTPTNLILSNPALGPRAIVKGQDNAQIQVKLTNQFGCQSTLSSTINIIDLANKVKFTLDKGTIKVGESAKVTVTGCTNCTFEWTPTTGVSDPKSGNPTLSPTKTTEYRVKVTSGNCMADFTVKVEVLTPCTEPYIFVPNSFTPNGDGQNDYFRVRGQDIATIDFRVLNRWGQQMYYSTDPNDIGWDGTFQGKPLPPDVYGYYVVIQCKDGTFYTKKGNVTLFR
jgi:gliding motility-associated-like protein